MSIVHVPETPITRASEAWRQCVGTGRLNLALRSDYRDSLALVQRDIGFRYIRGHGLLSDDVGIRRPYEHDGREQVRFAFTYADQIVDAYLELGLAPFVELGFMPESLASGDDTVFWWKGNITPPRDEREWERLVTATVSNLVDRYGLDAVRTWPIEVWNEPNLPVFWSGSQSDYFRLYEITANAVKNVDASLQVGGPAVSPGADDWWAPFADFVTSRDLPVDFVSSHAYTTGPAQHVPFGTYQTTAGPQWLLDQFAAPSAHLQGTRLEGLPVHITEFNTSYRPDNPVHDTAFNAAFLASVLTASTDVASMSYWTFSDVFEEVGIPTSFFHGGFGMLAHRQVRKPTYHLYAFLARCGAEVLARGADHYVTRHPSGRVTVLAWQSVGGTDDPAEPSSHSVDLDLPLAGTQAYVARARVNDELGNAFTAWQRMGRPLSPTATQLDALHEASEPARSHASHAVTDGRLRLKIGLDRHEITLVEIDPVIDQTPSWVDDSRILGRTA